MNKNFVAWFSDPFCLTFKVNLDHYPAAERQNILERVVKVYQRFLRERFPSDKGFHHAFKKTTPYSDQGYKQVNGYSLKVHRGLFWGYAVHVYPTNPQIDAARLSINFDILLVARCWLCAMGLGVLAALLFTFLFIRGGGMRRGDAWVIGLFTVVVVFGAMVIFWLGSRFLEKANCPSPQAIEDEMEALRTDFLALTENLPADT